MTIQLLGRTGSSVAEATWVFFAWGWSWNSGKEVYEPSYKKMFALYNYVHILPVQHRTQDLCISRWVFEQEKGLYFTVIHSIVL